MPGEEPVFDPTTGRWNVVDERDSSGSPTSITHFDKEDDALAYWNGDGGCC